jgi:hypothetical protein
MHDIVGRLFLLLLLAVDWAADPSVLAPAVKALAAPMASTECFCHSWSNRQDIRNESAPASQPTFSTDDMTGAACCPQLPCLWAEPVPAAHPPTHLVYVFMAIRC